MVAEESAKRRDDIARGRELAGILTRLDRLRHVHENLAELGTADLRILWLLRERQPSTLAEIAAELKLEQSTVNRQVNAAFAAELLSRERREPGGPYVFTPTQTGREAFERDVTASLGAYESALAAMGDADAEWFLRLARRFLDDYSAVVADDDRHSGAQS